MGKNEFTYSLKPNRERDDGSNNVIDRYCYQKYLIYYFGYENGSSIHEITWMKLFVD